VLQEVDIIVTDTLPWLIVEDTIGPDAGSIWSFDGNASIKACMGSLCHVRPITEPLVLEEIVDDVNFASILVVAIRPLVSFRNIDGVFTD
jgi:hypothetical protein